MDAQNARNEKTRHTERNRTVDDLLKNNKTCPEESIYPVSYTHLDVYKRQEMELDTIGDRKTALFVIISDTDDTFNFVVAIMYSQLLSLIHISDAKN